MTLNRNCIMNWWTSAFWSVCGWGTQEGLEKEVHPKFSQKHAHKYEPPPPLRISLSFTETHLHTDSYRNTEKQNDLKNVFQHSLLKIQFDNILPGIIKITDELQMLIPSINLYCKYSCLDFLGGPVFSRNYLVACEVCWKHSLLALQYILRKALFTNTVRRIEAVNR